MSRYAMGSTLRACQINSGTTKDLVVVDETASVVKAEWKFAGTLILSFSKKTGLGTKDARDWGIVPDGCDAVELARAYRSVRQQEAELAAARRRARRKAKPLTVTRVRGARPTKRKPAAVDPRQEVIK